MPTIESLGAYREFAEFDCGDMSVNAWIRGRGRSSQANDDARSYVAVQEGQILGFYALAVSSIIHAGLPAALRRNAPEPIGCVLLAQLGVQIAHQGAGLGRILVLHAMGQAVKIAALAGCRLFALHPARPDLVAYDARFGFREVDATPKLMVMPLKQVRTILASIG